MELSITRSKNLKSKPDDANLGFGTIFTESRSKSINAAAVKAAVKKIEDTYDIKD